MNVIRRSSNHFGLLLLCILLGTGFASSSSSQAQSAQTASSQTASAAAFEKIKSLAGTWEANAGTGKVTSTFRVTSGGTAVVETFMSPDEGEMVTIYTLDGSRVLLTHYCDTGNQPRMQAASYDSKTNQIAFGFLDATGLTSPNDPHMHQVVFTFTSANEHSENWSFFKDGKSSMVVPITFHRVS